MRRYERWSPERVEWLRAERAAGKSAREIAAGSGLTIPQVNNACKDYGIMATPRGARPVAVAAFPPPPPPAPEPTFGATLEDLRPVQIAGAFPRRRVVSAETGVTVVAGDMHFGAADEPALSVLLEAIHALRPGRVILNGDLPDLLAISKYPKDARKQWDLRDEATAMHVFLRQLESVIPKDCEVLETEANHSGNGIGSRWWRYLSDRVPQLLALPGADGRLSYQAWWHPIGSRIQLVPDVVIGDLLVTHGDVVRKWGAFSGRAHAEKYLHGVLHNHTHRQGSSVQRVPAIGDRKEGVIRSYETGCLCSLAPMYADKPNWTHGFAVVTHQGSGHPAVELVTIVDGVACVGALGKELRAA